MPPQTPYPSSDPVNQTPYDPGNATYGQFPSPAAPNGQQLSHPDSPSGPTPSSPQDKQSEYWTTQAESLLADSSKTPYQQAAALIELKQRYQSQVLNLAVPGKGSE